MYLYSRKWFPECVGVVDVLCLNYRGRSGLPIDHLPMWLYKWTRWELRIDYPGDPNSYLHDDGRI